MKKIAVISLILFLAFFLRFYKLGEVPPGLYIDEASIGYNAYSILTSGVDEFGQSFPLWFRSFGDYKPPVYIYLTSASIALFGKNEFAVRFPSAIFGTLTVLVTYFLVKQLFQTSHLPFLTSFILAISPWHLQFSRAAFEANVALFFFVLASFLVAKFWQGKKILTLFLSFFFYGLTLYTYHAYRIITPLWVVMLVIMFLRNLPRLRKTIILAILFILLIIIPSITYSLSEQGQARFNLTSAFAYEKPQNYPSIFFKNYFSYFSLPFLFASGDGIGRHQIDGFGPLSYWQIPFFLTGLVIFLKKRKEPLMQIILFFLLLSPLPAALARPSPHVLRSLPMVTPFILIIAMGIIYCWDKFGKRGKFFLLLVFAIGFYEFLSYLHGYYVHYPQNHQMDWGGAYKQTVERTKMYLPKYSSIFVSDGLGDHTNIYFLFYGQEIPRTFVPETWQKPKELGKTVVYVTKELSDTDKKPVGAKFLENIYLDNPNRDIFAQFWEL